MQAAESELQVNTCMLSNCAYGVVNLSCASDKLDNAVTTTNDFTE